MAGLACRRAMAGLGLLPRLGLPVGGGIARLAHSRQVSHLVQPNGNRAFLIDTLELVRRLEAQGIPSKHAEAITFAVSDILNNGLHNLAHEVVSKMEMQKSELMQDFNVTKCKSKMQISQEHHFYLLQQETEKLKGDFEKMRSELRHEFNEVTAARRLDLNLERGRIREEFVKQNDETIDLTNKLDREMQALKTQLEAAKYEVIKYCIGTLVSISAVGLAAIRILL